MFQKFYGGWRFQIGKFLRIEFFGKKHTISKAFLRIDATFLGKIYQYDTEI